MSDADLPFVAALFASIRAPEVAQIGWDEETCRAFLSQQHQAQHRHYATYYAGMDWLILDRGGEDIGRLYLHETANAFRVVDISLVEQRRNQGIGRALLEDVQALARRSGKSVDLQVDKTNPARRLYDRLGFTFVSDEGFSCRLEWRPNGSSTGS